ncbi:hypothetical protein O3Q52_36205 [Streptomyces sp. ActVer]|uniref:hypothetical protein n=1 Tax=Streptomyces sp. ActVer TaxID=3014558 RepID=UPI0022B3BCF1|nr:hypothetical protein [Streptomyces sp. ActVer]MCZ4513498.1 hypothetical protein [Streptomyces sp. ActVer]
MTDRHTVDSITSDALDQLYRERDEARQHAATIAAQRDRLRQRMNTLADRWDNALAPDKAYARTLRDEISVAPFDPDGAMTVHDYTEHGRHWWAFRCWGTDICDGWLGLGHHTQTSALLERERHVAEAHGEPGPAATEATEPVVSVHGARDLTPDAREGLDALIGVAKKRITEDSPAAAVEVRDPCPRCEGSPALIPRHAMTDHMRAHHPEEHPVRDLRVLAPRLPRTTRVRLRAEHHIDGAAVWLIERRHFRVARWLWRVCRMW